MADILQGLDMFGPEPDGVKLLFIERHPFIAGFYRLFQAFHLHLTDGFPIRAFHLWVPNVVFHSFLPIPSVLHYHTLSAARLMPYRLRPAWGSGAMAAYCSMATRPQLFPISRPCLLRARVSPPPGHFCPSEPAVFYFVCCACPAKAGFICAQHCISAFFPGRVPVPSAPFAAALLPAGTFSLLVSAFLLFWENLLSLCLITMAPLRHGVWGASLSL